MEVRNKIKNGVLVFFKVIGMMTCLYLFICSLSFLSTSFRILGGRNIGTLFEQSDLLKNPVVGVMIGVLVTVLVQSSSTSTSIIVGMVSAGAPVREAIPMVMGANIGTSITNIIVSITQVSDRERFRRAFSCATVHDMFNWLSVILLVTVETATHYLENLTGFIVQNINLSGNFTKPDFLKVLTTPLTNRVIQLDKKVLESWAKNDPVYENVTSQLAIVKKSQLANVMGDISSLLSKVMDKVVINKTISQIEKVVEESMGEDVPTPTVMKTSCFDRSTEGNVFPDDDHAKTCSFILAYLGPQGYNIGDIALGIILLIISLVLLISCLLGVVKILNSMLGGKMTGVITNVINADIPNKYLAWITGYLAMAVGAVVTILLQSSSVFVSTLVPLAGAGLVSTERAYPMALGSNIGTTTTSLLASFAADSTYIDKSVQIALVHLFFNLTGILIFYPLPFMRFPIAMAKVLGDTTARYRWFAVFYLLFMFLFLPSFIFSLSMAGTWALYAFLGPAVVLLLIYSLLSLLQKYKPAILPQFLLTWEFLPLPLRSLEPLDRVITGVFRLSRCCGKNYEVVNQTDGSKLEMGNMDRKTPAFKRQVTSPF